MADSLTTKKQNKKKKKKKKVFLDPSLNLKYFDDFIMENVEKC